MEKYKTDNDREGLKIWLFGNINKTDISLSR
jgi:hypothetical protein